MSKLTIHWPKRNTPIKSTLLLVLGRADGTIVGVTGECRAASDGSVTKGKTIALYVDRTGKKAHDKPYRWMIAFRLPQIGGAYELTVNGVSEDGKKAVDSRHFLTSAYNLSAIAVAYPENGQNITDEADDFVAYGDLNCPLALTEMTPNGGSAIQPTHTFSDDTDLFFWSAQFPPLSSGTYTLHVEDNEHHSRSVVNLAVN